MDARMENVNYANDPRNCRAAERPKLYFYGCGTCGAVGETCDCPPAPAGESPIEGQHFYGRDIERELPMKWAVCYVCEGRGTHVNPSIDAGGISAESFYEDPDFAEEYMRGTYDQTCNLCKGRTTVPAVDWDALSEDERKAYQQQLREEDDDRACQMAEIRAGC